MGVSIPLRDVFRAFPQSVRNSIIDERLQQDARWGPADERTVSLVVLGIVLGEEVGEVHKAILHGPIDGRDPIKAELVQVAATAIAMILALDGNAPLGVEPEHAG